MARSGSAVKYHIDDIKVPFAEIAQPGAGPRSVSDLLRAWEAFVNQVVRGYEDSIYEYKNDLIRRDVIERAFDYMSPQLAERVRARLTSIDDRFFQATAPVAKPLQSEKDIASAPWWFRIPRRLSAELAQDLRFEGFPLDGEYEVGS